MTAFIPPTPWPSAFTSSAPSPTNHPLISRPRRRRPRPGPPPLTCVFTPDEGFSAPLPPPLQLGPLTVSPPVILAPMAGVTNYPFRKLCMDAGAGLCVSEMLLAKNVVDGKADGKARFGKEEFPRSAQLYGTSPSVMAAAAERLVTEGGVQHVDLNFGCPAPKVLRKGGGAAVAADRARLEKIVRSVVDAVSPHGVPVTAKIRMGLRYHELNYLEAGRILEGAGVSAVVLHARTAADGYAEGAARGNWLHIAALASELSVPVLANGDIFTATDGLRVLRRTGAAGVVIGRGCLGRPWLFRDFVDAFRNSWASEVTVPGFAVVAETMMEHLRVAVEWQAADGVSEKMAVMSMRKWFGWYWKGYNGLPALWVPRMCKEETVAGVRAIVAEADSYNVSYSYDIIVGSRGKYGPLPGEKPRDPPMPARPKKSASQRLPKTEKGRRQKAERDNAKEKDFLERRERVLEFRRKKALPRRRAMAPAVKEKMLADGMRMGTLPGKFLLPEHKFKRGKVASQKVESKLESDDGFVAAIIGGDEDEEGLGDEVEDGCGG